MFKKIPHHEFWPAPVFEAPFYIYLALQCLKYRVSPVNLAKANYALNHGEIGIGSKFETQMCFCQKHFLPTVLVSSEKAEDLASSIQGFVDAYGYPIIIKPDIGMVGKGVVRVANNKELENLLPELQGKFLVQKYTPYACEFGVFYVRENGQSRITGINQKHFPAVQGDGVSDMLALAQQHPRYTADWKMFLKYHDLDQVLAEGEQRRLSFIGSHTMGCMFTDVSDLANEDIKLILDDIIGDQAGFNYGRFDLKAESVEEFCKGNFVVIELNGVSSLPTHMFDPKYNLAESYKIFFQHGKLLAKIAAEYRRQSMQLMSIREVLRAVKANQAALDSTHQQLKRKQF